MQCTYDAASQKTVDHDVSMLNINNQCASVAQHEMDNIKQRQAEGIAVAKLQGKHLGRAKATLPEGFERIYAKWKKGEITAKQAMHELGLKPTTFYKLVKESEGR